MNRLLIVLLVCCMTGWGVMLGENGTAFTIVLSGTASETEKCIAEELREGIRQATGAACPIGIAAHGAHFISIETADLPSEESWRILIESGNVRLQGGGPRGVCYAAYEFMERYLDIRWLGVGYTSYPEAVPRSLPNHAEHSGTPAFPLNRHYYLFPTDLNHRNEECQVFFAHNKTNIYNEAKYGFGRRFGSPGAGHTYLAYSADFPLEICWMNKQGERVQVRSTAQGQVCYTHPQVRRRFKEKLRAYIEKDCAVCREKGLPYPLVYDISMNDCDAQCHCPQCLAEAERYGVSGMVARFTGEIASSIQKDYPEIRVQMFAYKDTVFPPKEAALPDNLIVRLAAMDGEFNGVNQRDVMRPLDTPQNKPYGELIEAWERTGAHLAIWDYWKMYYEPFATPFGGIRDRADYLKFYQVHKAESVFIEAEMDFKKPVSFYELRAYMAMKLMDNPKRDVEALVDDYFAHAFRQAAPPVKAYWELLEKLSTAEPRPLAQAPLPSRSYWTPEFFVRANELLDKAVQLEPTHPRIQTMLKTERLVLDLAHINLPRITEALAPRFPVAMLEQRILENYQAYAGLYWKESSRMLADFREEFVLMRNRPPLPDEFKEKSVVDLLWYDVLSGDKVKDEDAAGGYAAQIRTTHFKGTESQFHAFDFECGIYDFQEKKGRLAKTFPREQLFQDEKYHFYYLGITRLSVNNSLWFHHTWLMSAKLDKVFDSQDPAREYDVFVSVKFQGPAYVKDSAKPNALRVDRMIFVRK